MDPRGQPPHADCVKSKFHIKNHREEEQTIILTNRGNYKFTIPAGGNSYPQDDVATLLIAMPGKVGTDTVTLETGHSLHILTEDNVKAFVCTAYEAEMAGIPVTVVRTSPPTQPGPYPVSKPTRP